MIRHSTAGRRGLISPPPTTTSTRSEDLKQLIYDLRCATASRISSSSLSEVASARSPQGSRGKLPTMCLISGHDGGTGRLSALLDLLERVCLGDRPAEEQQTLLLNDLRSPHLRQTDGQLKTVAMRDRGDLGADEMGFGHRPADRERLHHDGGLPSQHVSGRHRHADRSAQSASAGTPARHQLLPFVAEEVRGILAASVCAPMDG